MSKTTDTQLNVTTAQSSTISTPAGASTVSAADAPNVSAKGVTAKTIQVALPNGTRIANPA